VYQIILYASDSTKTKLRQVCAISRVRTGEIAQTSSLSQSIVFSIAIIGSIQEKEDFVSQNPKSPVSFLRICVVDYYLLFDYSRCTGLIKMFILNILRIKGFQTELGI
jgi:hypothetical protein